MLNKKLAALVFALSLAFGTFLSKIYVPDGFEKPNIYRVMSLLMGLGGLISNGLVSLNIGHQAINYREFLTILTLPIKYTDDAVDLYESKINNVKVRVYKPKSSTKSDKPIMVYYHGGGYAYQDTAAYDAMLFGYVKSLEMVIVSVDYRMAPEYPYPTPVDDCYTVTQYILKNANEFGCDSARVVLAGDSAGGNAVAVITQRLLDQKEKLPKIQVLIYPWTQMVNLHMPSALYYREKSFTSPSKITFPQFISWYLGISDVTQEIQEAFESNNHTLILDNFFKYMSYMDVSKIPQKYKSGRAYYDYYESIKGTLYPKYKLHDSNVLIRDKNVNFLIKKLTSREFSPLLADSDKLIGLPKAYFIVLEWDTLKDEGLLYAERLKEAGVDVNVAFYDKAFHGIVGLVDSSLFGFEIAKRMQTELIEYLKANL